MALPSQSTIASFRSRCRHAHAQWFAAICVALLVLHTGCMLPFWALGAGGGSNSGIAHDDPRSGEPAHSDPASHALTAAKISPVIDNPGALADPRWMLVADDSANPLAAAAPADMEAGVSVLNSRMGGRWRPASAQVGPGQIAPPPDRSHRWRHAGLELLMAQAADKRPDLHLAMKSADPIVATNAAILLSRQHDPAAFEPLWRAIRASETNSWQRRAAVEAFSELALPAVAVELRSLVDEQGKFTGDAERSYQPDLHLELLHALAHAEAAENAPPLGPTGEPRFAAALASPAANVRREALAALADSRFGPLPANIVRYVGDADSGVRRAALHTLTVRRHPEAFELLKQALLDQDLIVRVSATADLGRLGGPEAIAQLRQMAAQGTELIRAAAVAALMQSGDDQIVAVAIHDKSWRVRRALVPILDRPQSPYPADLAERLVADVNSDVARAAIDALARWPLADAGPILMTAMEGRIYLTRKAAAQQLAKRWPPANDFEIEAAAQRRAAEMAQLRQRWREDSSVAANQSAPPVTANAQTPAITATTAGDSEQKLAEVQRLLAQWDRPMTAAEHAEAIHALVAVGPELPTILWRVVQATPQPLPEEIYREALPAVSVEFAAIERLAAADARQQRQAADALRTFAAGLTASRQRLGDLALDRLASLIIRSDGGENWGWIVAMMILADDDREPATRLAYAGLSHPAPEVRRLACQHLELHPDPHHAALLAKSLTDVNPTVVEVAVRALGRLPSLDDPRPLEGVLAAEDHALRVEAAEALARFGFPSGISALERLGYDPAPKIRRMAAIAMGRAADRSFVPVLIHLLDDRPEVARAALESLPHAAGRDMPPANSLANDSPPNAIQRWKDWYRADNAGR